MYLIIMMAKQRIPMIDGDEYDALCHGNKSFYNWRAGQRKAIKRKYNKRIRKYFKKFDDA